MPTLAGDGEVLRMKTYYKRQKDARRAPAAAFVGPRPQRLALLAPGGSSSQSAAAAVQSCSDTLGATAW